MQTIGYFDFSPGPGGTTRYLLELLNGLDRSRYRAVLFAPFPVAWHDDARALGAEFVYGEHAAPAPEAVATPSVNGDQAVPAPAANSRGPLTQLKRRVGWELGLRRESAEFVALFRRERVDLFHSNVVGDEVAPIAARRAGMPIVVATLHTDPTYDIFGTRSGPRHIKLQRQSLGALDVAIAVSQSTAMEWRNHLGFGLDDPPPIKVIPNGIRLDRLLRRRSREDAKRLLDLPADALVIGSVGRLDWAKGYGDLIAALPRVVAAAPNVLFVHAGTGPLAEQLAAHATRLGIAERVRWLGFRSDVRDLLEACDIYTQPSWCETQGLAVLEAGALAVPVVASSAGGLPESLDHGTAGRLIPPRDSARLADALLELIRSPGVRAQLGEALRTRVEQLYTNDRMVDATVTLYDELLHHSTAELAVR